MIYAIFFVACIAAASGQAFVACILCLAAVGYAGRHRVGF